ncbi:hypothetical protein C8Q77DRAFT_301496 [Trametes polyzona]|nr:hypothetical protein C8Q77DRAFT_301496 [Trametes polyzona]
MLPRNMICIQHNAHCQRCESTYLSPTPPPLMQPHTLTVSYTTLDIPLNTDPDSTASPTTQSGTASPSHALNLFALDALLCLGDANTSVPRTPTHTPTTPARTHTLAPNPTTGRSIVSRTSHCLVLDGWFTPGHGHPAIVGLAPLPPSPRGGSLLEPATPHPSARSPQVSGLSSASTVGDAGDLPSANAMPENCGERDGPLMPSVMDGDTAQREEDISDGEHGDGEFSVNSEGVGGADAHRADEGIRQESPAP